MDTQLPLRQIELKNNKLFTIIIIFSTFFSIFNFLLNYYLIKSISLNTNSNKSDFLVKNHAKINNILKTRAINGSKFNEFRLENENSIKLWSKDRSSYLLMTENRIEMQTDDFRVFNQDEKTGKKTIAFRLKNDEIYVKNIENIHTQKQGGLDVKNSLETQSITGSFSKNLELNSLTKNIDINSKNGLSLESKYSQINLDSLKDLNLNGEQKIILDSKYIQIKKLNRATNKMNENNEMQSQVCVCKNGKLFTIAGNKLCEDDNRSFCY